MANTTNKQFVSPIDMTRRLRVRDTMQRSQTPGDATAGRGSSKEGDDDSDDVLVMEIDNPLKRTRSEEPDRPHNGSGRKPLIQTTLNFGVPVDQQLRKELQEKEEVIASLRDTVTKLENKVKLKGMSEGESAAALRQVVENMERYCAIMREVMLENAVSTRREARRVQHLLHYELGHDHCEVGPYGQMIEGWVKGQKEKELLEKLDGIKRRQEVVTSARRELLKLRRPTKRAESDELSSGIMGSDTQFDAQDLDELHRLEGKALEKQEKEVEEKLLQLEQEKIVFQREVERIRAEDSSRFNNVRCIGERERYVLIRLLGRGGFSEVWKAFDLFEARYVCCKMHQIDPSWSEQKKNHYTRHALREYNIHKELDHRNLTKHYDQFTLDGNTFVCVIEYSHGSDLEMRLKRHKVLKEAEARAIFLQIVSALRYLNEQKTRIIHYDLKPANIIFHSGDSSSLEVKITDFGLAKIMSESGSENIELTTQGAGTLWYLPPECFETGAVPQISPKVDIWAAGVVFYQMLYGRKPFGDTMSQKQLWQEKAIVKQSAALEFPAKPAVSAEAKDIIRRCLDPNVHERIDVVSLSLDQYLHPPLKRGRTNQSVAPQGAEP